MKSTPRNLMAGMNVSRDQKVGRAHQRAKGLPQDGVHAGGQTYDSSKPSETTSNHQTTTSDYEYGEGSFFCRRCWRGSTPVMQIHRLRYFCAVARTGSFTRAAEQEHLAQPSLSQQVRKLEDELGTRLFDRLGRSVRLTSFGETFLPRAEAILRQVEDAKHEIEEMAGDERGEVVGGATPTSAA